METERERVCVCVCAEWRDSNRHNRGRQTEDQIKPDKAILVINKCISNNIRERNSHTGWTRERRRGRGREREGKRQRQTFRAWMAAVGSCQSVGIDLEEEGRRRES